MLDDKLKQQIFLEIAMPICIREKVMLIQQSYEVVWQGGSRQAA